MLQSPVILWYQPDTAPFSFKSPDFSLCQQALAVAGFERVECQHASQLLSEAVQRAQRYPKGDVLRASMVAIMCAGMAENATLAHLLRTEQPQMGIAALVPDLQEETQLLALQSGIDCWFTETASARLVMATVFGLIRRMGSIAPAEVSGVGEQRWRLLEHGWQLKTPDGMAISLSTGERALMMALARAEAHQATYQHLLAQVGNQAGKNENKRRERLTMMVSRMKKKCEALGVDLPIRALHRRGYMFNGLLDIADATRS